MDVESMLAELIDREGGYVNNPSDKGGVTNYGITQATLSAARGHPCSADDVRELTAAEAKDIYRAQYLIETGLYKIKDPYVLVLAFDCAVNHGPQRAVRWLQQIVGVPDDGNFGDQTEVAVASYEPVRLYQKLLARRVRFYGQLIANDQERLRASQAGFHLQATFAGGWLNRAASFIET